MPDFRFQGSWADDATKLSWVVTRWYAPAQGRFISEDSPPGRAARPRLPPPLRLRRGGAGRGVGPRGTNDCRNRPVSRLASYWDRRVGDWHYTHNSGDFNSTVARDLLCFAAGLIWLPAALTCGAIGLGMDLRPKSKYEYHDIEYQYRYRTDYGGRAVKVKYFHGAEISGPDPYSFDGLPVGRRYVWDDHAFKVFDYHFDDRAKWWRTCSDDVRQDALSNYMNKCYWPQIGYWMYSATSARMLKYSNPDVPGDYSLASQIYVGKWPRYDWPGDPYK